MHRFGTCLVQALGIGLLVFTGGGCVSLPDDVAEELSAPDDIRPNNYALRKPQPVEGDQSAEENAD